MTHWRVNDHAAGAQYNLRVRTTFVGRPARV